MTTAELIKKREEEKNYPPQSPNTSPFKPTEGMNMSEDRIAGNGVSSSEIKADVPATGKTDNRVSLYEVGKNSGGTNIGEAEKMLKGNVSPITTPEYEKFRNEVIGAQQFGVETEEQKKKRERADFIKQGLTGLTEGLTSLANLYYTTKWAPNQKMVSQMPALQQQLYRERLERDKKLENFRAWQRAKAEKDADREYNLSLYNFKQEAANKAADLKYKRDVLLAEIKNQLELGKIDKKKAADLELQAAKAKSAQDLEKIKFGYDVALKKTTSASDDKVVDSVQVGEDVYTRNSKLTDNELRTLAKYNQHPEEFTTIEGGDKYGISKGKEVFDWKNAAINAINSGNVPPEILEQMGFKKRNASKYQKSIEGFSDKKQNSKKTISGF